MNAFCAKLSTYGIPRLDMRPYAAWAMRHTLEKAPWEIFHHTDIDEREDPEDDNYPAWREYELEFRDVKSLNTWVPAAAVWIKINGKGLCEMEGLMGDEWEWNTINWKGLKEWLKERFVYWRERFEWISKVTALDKSTKEDAKGPAELMKRIEEGS